MKNLLFLLGGLVLAAPAYGQGFQTGTFDLYATSGHQPSGTCDRGTNLVLDRAEIKGNLAFLTEFVAGVCDLYVEPNARYYEIHTVKDAGCGSQTYEGTRIGDDGRHEVVITDHRTRLCMDIVPGRVIVTEKGPRGEVTLYSYDR
ncbi:MAG: hypothetical protein AB7G93_16835 [Bdellovibrionales bacterium]